jgi:hypothetical protein
MSTGFSSNAQPQTALSDDQVVEEAISKLEAAPDAEFARQRELEEQRRLAWERDQARIRDFFDHPSQYITQYWRQYKPFITSLLIVALALFALNVALGLVSFITHLPLITPLLKLVGFGYTAWFVYRYLLKAETRQELLRKINEIKQEIVGATEEIVGDNSIE